MEVLEQEALAAGSEEKVFAPQYDLWSIPGADRLPQAKLDRHKKGYLLGVIASMVENTLDNASKMGNQNGDVI